jgi:hypothetical protein
LIVQWEQKLATGKVHKIGEITLWQTMPERVSIRDEEGEIIDYQPYPETWFSMSDAVDVSAIYQTILAQVASLVGQLDNLEKTELIAATIAAEPISKTLEVSVK